MGWSSGYVGLSERPSRCATNRSKRAGKTNSKTLLERSFRSALSDAPSILGKRGWRRFYAEALPAAFFVVSRAAR